MAIAATIGIVVLMAGLLIFSKMITGSPDSTSSDYSIKKNTDGPILAIPGFSWPEKPVLISFWAAWCAPCVEELPDLQAFAGEQSKIHVLLVNIDDPESDHYKQAEALLSDLGHLAFEHIYTSADIFQAFGGQSLPAHFLFSGDKQKIWESNGKIPWKDPETKKQLFSVIDED